MHSLMCRVYFLSHQKLINYVIIIKNIKLQGIDLYQEYLVFNHGHDKQQNLLQNRVLIIVSLLKILVYETRVTLYKPPYSE